MQKEAKDPAWQPPKIKPEISDTENIYVYPCVCAEEANENGKHPACHVEHGGPTCKFIKINCPK